MRSNKRIPLFLLLSFFFFSIHNFAQNSEKPNVIIINADDLGYGDTGVYGATKVQTPNIDKLAAEGKRFTDAHSASAVCTPSRYALITGEYAFRINNALPVFSRDSLIVDPEKLTIADVMKEQDYKTGIIGKWHLGFGDKKPTNWNEELKPGPLELGFDYYFGVPVLNSHPPFVYVENHKVLGLEEDDPMEYGKQANTAPYPEKWNRGLQKIGGADAAHKLYIDSLVGTTLKNKAVKFIQENKENPFFLYLATTNIHHPFTPARRFIGSSDAGRYGDFIHELDWIVGEVMNTLEKENLNHNTLVIFTSDNGGMLNQGGQDAYSFGHRNNGDLLGFKFGAWEGGHRVPFIAWWPGKIDAGSVSDQLISNVDLTASLAALFERDLKDGEAIDSFNLLPALLDNPQDQIRPHLIISPGDRSNISLRKGKWMYISDQNSGGFPGEVVGMHDFGGAATLPFTGQKNSDIENGKIKKDAPPAQLYNLEEDPYQHTNVYNKHPEVVEKMKSELSKLRESKKTRP